MEITSVRAIHLCIRGSRVPAHKISVQRLQWEDMAGLALFQVRAPHHHEPPPPHPTPPPALCPNCIKTIKNGADDGTGDTQRETKSNLGANRASTGNTRGDTVQLSLL